jgi:hypothetical protein
MMARVSRIEGRLSNDVLCVAAHESVHGPTLTLRVIR